MLPSDSHPGPLRPGCAQPLFAIMHRSRAALLQLLRQVVQVKQRGRRVVAVADPGSRQSAGVPVSRVVIPNGLARQYHRTAPLVLRTRLQDRPTSSRSSSRCPAPSASTLCPSSGTGSDGHPQSTRHRWRGPAHPQPRTARGSRRQMEHWTTWSTGFAVPQRGGPGTRAPGPDPQPTVAVVRIQGWMRHS
jgi:hypothetical protein